MPRFLSPQPEPVTCGVYVFVLVVFVVVIGWIALRTAGLI